MPKYQAPSLAEITYAYIGMQRGPARMKDFESLENQFHKALIRTSSAEDLRAALALDTGRTLPVQMKSPIYERLLSVEGRSVALLRDYAQEMYEYGPEFAAYADRLWQEAKDLEHNGG